MGTITLQKNFLIVIILVSCLVCCAVSAGISVLVINSGGNPATGEQGEPGPTGQPGPTGAPGANGATGPSGSDGADGSDGEDGISEATYDSGWVDIRSLAGQNLTLTHNLDTTDLIVQIEGKDTSGNIHQKYIGLESSTIMGWNQTYSESSQFYVESAINTTDNAYVLTGVVRDMMTRTYSAFLLKMDLDGNIDWYRTYDLATETYGIDVVETSDGGFALTGYTHSINAGEDRAFLLKTDSYGNAEWNQIYNDETYSSSVIQTSDGGYALAGEAYLSAYGYGAWLAKTYSNGTLEWSKTYGADYAVALVQTSDGGYAFAGNFYNVTTYSDMILVKTNATGDMEWNATYGTMAYEYCRSLISTSDGGFAIVGAAEVDGTSAAYLVKTNADGALIWNYTYLIGTYTYPSEFSQANDGGFIVTGEGYDVDNYDVFLLKTAANGMHEWNATYGSDSFEMGEAVVVAPDGGYAAFGRTSQNTGLYSLYRVRTYENGTVYQTTAYSGQSRIYAYSMANTSDGGFILTGRSVSALSSGSNVYLVKTDKFGNMQWSKNYDFNGSERGYSVIQASDGGYAIAGDSDDDTLLLKTDANGTLEWNLIFDACNEDDYGYSVVQTSDGGFAVAGYTYTDDNSADVSLIKTNANGELLWNYTYGTTAYEACYSMVTTSDGGFALTGRAQNETTGNDDVLLLKIGATGNLLWRQVYTGEHDNYGRAIDTTLDGGFVIAGVIQNSATHSADVYLIKTNATGSLQWSGIYGDSDDEYGYSVVATNDGGYIIGGYLDSYVTYSYDGLLIKVNAAGIEEWTQTYDGDEDFRGQSVVATSDGGYALAGYQYSSSGYVAVLYKTTVQIELGLTRIALTDNTITLYRGAQDTYWQYVRVQIWKAD